jgi:glycerol kinase
VSKFVAAIDQGTTSTRCILFDHSGWAVSVAQKEHAQIFPRPGWVEHDPLEIWQRVQEVTSEALAKAHAGPGDIAAVGITNQRETTVVWNKTTGRPLCNAIVWQDTRTDQLCAELAKDGGQDRFRQKTGLPLATYFSGPKLRWMLDNVPAVRDAANRGDALFGNIDSWLIWWLTGGPQGGVHVTDVTNASRTMLMDLATLSWDADILRIMGIPANMLPSIAPSSKPGGYGFTLPDGPLSAAIPVCGALGDQQAALVGQTCFDVGEAKNTYGTGCFMLLNTGEEPIVSNCGLLTTVAYKFGDAPAHYALEGSIAVTGSLVQWLRDNLGIIERSDQVESLARTVEDNGGLYFVPAFSGLFAPYWQASARGTITGMTRFVNKGHIARAALEATAFQTREVLDAMEKDSGVTLRALKVDGGMVVNELLMQFQADILKVPVVRPRVAETTALGAAYAAGLAVGFWSGEADMRANWQVDRTWEPGMPDDQRALLYANWHKAVQRSMNWLDV